MFSVDAVCVVCKMIYFYYQLDDGHILGCVLAETQNFRGHILLLVAEHLQYYHLLQNDVFREIDSQCQLYSEWRICDISIGNCSFVTGKMSRDLYLAFRGHWQRGECRQPGCGGPGASARLVVARRPGICRASGLSTAGQFSIWPAASVGDHSKLGVGHSSRRRSLARWWRSFPEDWGGVRGNRPVGTVAEPPLTELNERNKWARRWLTAVEVLSGAWAPPYLSEMWQCFAHVPQRRLGWIVVI